MKWATDRDLIEALRGAQSGVFSTADLKTVLAERHPSGFKRRIGALLDRQVLSRFTRGFYVTTGFDLPTLSQRIAPESCISFETVLAKELVIGPSPERRVVATKVGRSRSYGALGYQIEHLGLSPRLTFGCKSKGGVRHANVEKAILDVLYFHLRGRRAAFDIFSDMNLRKVDKGRLLEYLTHYQNPKFVTFAIRALDLE